MKITNLKELKDNIDQLCDCLSHSGFALDALPLNFICHDKSEGIGISLQSIEKISFDFIAELKKVDIELS
jgi:hypothetical protein